MRTTVLAAAGVLFAGAPLAASAQLTTEDFQIRSAADLVDLCSATAASEVAKEAIHFCHGFVSGAWQYHQAQAAGPEGRRIVCPPEPPPTRDEAVAMFVAWSKQHPEHMQEPAVEAVFRFLTGKYPCPEPAKAVKKGGSK
jgi:hypothetical protein